MSLRSCERDWRNRSSYTNIACLNPAIHLNLPCLVQLTQAISTNVSPISNRGLFQREKTANLHYLKHCPGFPCR